MKKIRNPRKAILWAIYKAEVLFTTSLWSNWWPVGHILPATTCNQAREIIYYFAASMPIYFIYS
jgi:hypothetical protein